MRVNILFVAVAFTAASAQGSSGQENPAKNLAPPTPIVFAQQHSLASKALGEVRRVDIRLPPGYHRSAPSHSYPVLFVLDGEFMFETVSGIVGHLSSVGRMPEAIVVGIWNNTDDRLGLSPVFLDKDGNPSSFGGREAQYLLFFQEELLPFLESRFRTADFRILFGLSPTATFALHTFWRAPNLFQAHIAMVAGGSPGKVYPTNEKLADAIEKSLRSDPDRRAWLYLSSAESNFRQREEIGANLKDLEHRLQPYLSRGLSLKTEVVPGSAYATVLPSLMSGLELIFPSKEWDPRYLSFLQGEASALTHLESHFAGLSKKYGFPVVPLGDRFFNVNCLRGLGSRLRRQGRIEEAIQVFRRWVELYPRAPSPYFHLAYAHNANGQPQEALAVGRKGLELAREMSAQDLERYEDHFRTLRESILADGDSVP